MQKDSNYSSYGRELTSRGAILQREATLAATECSKRATMTENSLHVERYYSGRQLWPLLIPSSITICIVCGYLVDLHIGLRPMSSLYPDLIATINSYCAAEHAQYKGTDAAETGTHN